MGAGGGAVFVWEGERPREPKHLRPSLEVRARVDARPGRRRQAGPQAGTEKGAQPVKAAPQSRLIHRSGYGSNDITR